MSIRIASPADIPPVIASVLGFIPEDSLVVLGIGAGAPTARVDLAPGAVASMAPAVPHWSTVLVGVYTDDATLAAATIAEFRSTWPDLTVADAIHVDPLGAVNGEHRPSAVDLPPRRVLASRAAVEAEAAAVEAAPEALDVAWNAYKAGDGARAWCYLDRARAIGVTGESDLTARYLEHCLATAVNPRDAQI